MTPKESLSFVFSKVERFTPKVVIDLGNIALEGAINIATNAVKFVDTLSQAYIAHEYEDSLKSAQNSIDQKNSNQK